MKLKLRIIDFPAKRPQIKFRYKRTQHVFKRAERFFECITEADTIEELNDQVKGIMQAVSENHCVAVPVFNDPELMEVAPLIKLGDFAVPDLSGLDEIGLRIICDELGIPHNDRHCGNGLRELANAYFAGQVAFFNTFEVGETQIPAAPVDLIEAETARVEIEAEVAADELADKEEQGAAERAASPVNTLELEGDVLDHHLAGFLFKKPLEHHIRELTGVDLDRRENLPNLRIAAKAAIIEARAKQVADAKLAQSKSE
tara:strand:+ start:2869 stop:3642 length:774 start_codon:yes stop_codon:yes gene_type:complete